MVGAESYRNHYIMVCDNGIDIQSDIIRSSIRLLCRGNSGTSNQRGRDGPGCRHYGWLNPTGHSGLDGVVGGVYSLRR